MAPSHNRGPPVDRRSVLKYGGAMLGGVAVGPTIVGAEESGDRYIVDTKNASKDPEDADVEVIHDLEEVDLAVVRGSEEDVEGIGGEFAADTAYTVGSKQADDDRPEAEDSKDEPFYHLQWDKQVQEIPDVHAITRGEDVRVAVLDSGVDDGSLDDEITGIHPDLEHAVNTDLSRGFSDVDGDGQIETGFGDLSFHGTHVSGIVAADDGNDFGTLGSAPGVDLVAVRVFDGPDHFWFSDMLAGLVYSANVNCDVANLSLGTYTAATPFVRKFYSQRILRVVNYAKRQGMLLVSAAGNQAADLQHDPKYIQLPGEAPNVLNVSATAPLGFRWDADGDGETSDLAEPEWTPAPYTNYGTNAIHVSAPGGRFTKVPFDAVLSTVPRRFGFTHTWARGTSMAAPQVAAAAALVKSVDPEATPGQLKTTLQRTAADKGKEGADPYHGKGFVDPLAAVKDADGNGNGN